jgi:hypothetical protein
LKQIVGKEPHRFHRTRNLLLHHRLAVVEAGPAVGAAAAAAAAVAVVVEQEAVPMAVAVFSVTAAAVVVVVDVGLSWFQRMRSTCLKDAFRGLKGTNSTGGEAARGWMCEKRGRNKSRRRRSFSSSSSGDLFS